MTEAAAKLNCACQTVKNWIVAKENNKPLHNFSHRPPLCSPNKRKEILEEIEKKSKKRQAFNREELHKKLQKKVHETLTEENKPLRDITPRFTKRFINQQQLHTGNAEVLSNAHEVAKDDPRHAASFAALMKHLHDRVPRGQFLNMDKTSFDWIKNKHENEEAVFAGHRAQNFKVPTPKCSRPTGNCTVPMYIVASDGGKVGDVVYLIKDNAMKKDDIDVHSVPMLDVSNGVGSGAHLIFHGEFTSNTDAALSWVYEHVVVPFANQIRAGPGRAADSYVNLNLDGDPRQLQVSTQNDVIGMFTQAKIIVGKSPASCTPIFQPLDAGKLFLAAKTRFNKLINGSETLLSDEDSTELKRIFQDHRRKYPLKTGKKGSASAALGSHFADVLKCLPAVAAALREVPIHRVVSDSFRDTGVSPFSASVIRNKCTYEWTPAQEAQFDAAVPVLAEKIGAHYELKESDFDNCNIPTTNKSKDGVSVHMRRALLLHGPHIVQALREQAMRGQKDE